MTLEMLEERLGIHFNNKALLEQAFIHRSYINENPKLGMSHNERLEFLGDAVLELVVTESLYSTYKDKNEGDLTAYRSALVNANTIGDVAHGLQFNDLIKLSKGESKDISKARLSILADAYEAFLGALYLDQGYEVAKKVILETLLPKTKEILEKGLYKDAKSFVQEKAQEVFSVTPAYKVLDQMGPDHDKRFVVGIYFGDDEVAQGEGKSKQEAETAAATNALTKKGWVK